MKSKRKRIRRNTKINAIEELSKHFKMSYGYTFRVYMEAMKYCRVFKDQSIIDRMQLIINNRGSKSNDRVKTIHDLFDKSNMIGLAE